MGNVLLRVMDRQERFALSTLCRQWREESPFQNGILLYHVLRSAVPEDPVSPNLGPDGRPIGLIVEQGIRLFNLYFKTSGHGGLQTTESIGQMIGKITAKVIFNPATPGGTALDPIPFTAYDEFVFVDHAGRRLGTFTADSSEGRVFTTLLAGQPGIRFGGVGQILSGTGQFEGISGLMTDNSTVVFVPHVSRSLYILRIYDPHGKFRATD